MAETFSVPSLRQLQSIQLRVGLANNIPAIGQFEVALYRWDPLNAAFDSKLAAVLADAQDYQFDLLHVPVSSFDFSSFNVSLNPLENYAFAVTPTSTFSGTLTLQGARSIYPGGEAFSLSVVPEPSVVALYGLGVVLSSGAVVARRRKIQRVSSLALKSLL